MEKYCFWEYVDGTLDAGDHEVRFRMPANKRFETIARSQLPRILQINPVLQAYCLTSPDLAPYMEILAGSACIESREHWKWLNSVFAQYLYRHRFIPARRDDGDVDMFPLGILRLEPCEEGVTVQTIENWRQRVAKESNYGASFLRLGRPESILYDDRHPEEVTRSGYKSTLLT